MPRITWKVTEPGLKSVLKGRQEPRLSSVRVKVFSLGDPVPPLSGIRSCSTSYLHPALHLSSWCHSHWSSLSSYPSQCFLALTSSPPVVERNISLGTQCSRLWVYRPRRVQILALPHVQPGKLVSSFPWDSIPSVKGR